MQRSRLLVRETPDQTNDGDQPRQVPGRVSASGKEVSDHATTL